MREGKPANIADSCYIDEFNYFMPRAPAPDAARVAIICRPDEYEPDS
ncbi:hypothetical protein BN137_1142 [Cronobacter condimenti 1330]|uniref:Uncharacterized protein n=1 Tax=Cronobacter condimenti 1330 TaxID=1073999 RepID=K7ZYY2_9ENTR|nr:hypothetical protein BN137_1142 [Cronobacter condimenti 1330]